MGAMHGARARMLLTRALDNPSSAIHRVPMGDAYGRPETPFHPAESAPAAYAKEIAAVMLTSWAIRNVKPGDLQGLKDAEEAFNKKAAKLASGA